MTQCVSSPYYDVCVSSSPYDDTCVCHHRPTMTPVCVIIALRWHSVCHRPTMTQCVCHRPTMTQCVCHRPTMTQCVCHRPTMTQCVCHHCPTMTQCVSSPYSSNPASTPCVLFEHCDFVSVVIVLCDVMSVLQLRWRVQGGISGSKTGLQKVPSLLARQLSLQLSVDMCVDCSVMSCYYCVVREVSVWQVSWRQDSSSSNS